jgi:hypothetical protein
MLLKVLAAALFLIKWIFHVAVPRAKHEIHNKTGKNFL